MQYIQRIKEGDEHGLYYDQFNQSADRGREECSVSDPKGRIDIPTFCYHSELSIYGACRMCVVEDDRGKYLQHARDTESGHGDLYEYKESAAVQKAYYRAVVILSLQRLYDLSEEWHVCAPVTCL